jgi:hypothetical protein
MTRGREAFVVTAVLAALVALAMISTISLGPVARRMPLLVAVPTFLLLLVELVRRGPSTSLPTPDRAPAERRLFAWVGGLLALVIVCGMTAGVPLFLVASARRLFGERWMPALAMALAMAVVLAGGLEYGLGIRLYPGIAGRWLQESLP